jgi:hypothetical protein
VKTFALQSRTLVRKRAFERQHIASQIRLHSSTIHARLYTRNHALMHSRMFSHMQACKKTRSKARLQSRMDVCTQSRSQTHTLVLTHECCTLEHTHYSKHARINRLFFALTFVWTLHYTHERFHARIQARKKIQMSGFMQADRDVGVSVQRRWETFATAAG